MVSINEFNDWANKYRSRRICLLLRELRQTLELRLVAVGHAIVVEIEPIARAALDGIALGVPINSITPALG